MMYLNVNYENSTSADYVRLLRMYRFADRFANPEEKCRIKVRIYILDKLIKKGEKVG